MKTRKRIITDEKGLGQPTKYRSEKHCALLIKVFSDGEGTAAFCDEANVCEPTLYVWLDTHPEFAAAYKIALQKGRRKWEKLGLRKDVNPTIWRAIMRNRFHYDKVRIKDLNVDGAATEHMKAIWKGIKDGELDTNDANKLAQLAISQVQIEDRAPIAESTILPRNELLRQIETIKAVMDAQKEVSK